MNELSVLEVSDGAHQAFSRLRPGLSPVLSKAHDIHFMSLEERNYTSLAAGELVFRVFSATSHFEQRLVLSGRLFRREAGDPFRIGSLPGRPEIGTVRNG